MALVTIDGHIGAGTAQLGRRVARMLDHRYVDRLVLPGHVSPNQPVQPKLSLSDRIWSIIEKTVRGVAMGNAAGDPYFATAELMMYPLTWDSSPGAPMAEAPAQGDDHAHSLQALIKSGSSVLVQRAGAVALKGHEQVLKIGVFGSWEDRIARVMHVYGFTRESEADRLIREREKAQEEYFGSMFSAHPEDENLYDICINTSREQMNLAAVRVARAARSEPILNV
jgi:cytidylate kinase